MSALTFASRQILEQLAAWSGMVHRGVSAYREMRVFDARAGGELHFDCADTEFNELGHIVENRVTIAALWDVLDTLENVVCITPAKVAEMQSDENGAMLRLEDGRIFFADLIVAADGHDSVLRKLAGIGVTSWEYGQHGLVATGVAYAISTADTAVHSTVPTVQLPPESGVRWAPGCGGDCSSIQQPHVPAILNHLLFNPVR